MTVEFRDLVAVAAVLITFVSMLIVSRNARRATSVHAESADLTRIRDLRQELKETKDELDSVKGQVHRLSRQLTEANEAAMEAYREREEMRRYARMPGMDIGTWLARFGEYPKLDASQ